MHHKVFSALALLTICSASKPIHTNKGKSNIDESATRDIVTADSLVDAISIGMTFLPPPYGIIMSIFTSTAYQLYDSNQSDEAQLRLQNTVDDIYKKVENISQEMKSGFQKLFNQLPEKIADDTAVRDMKGMIVFIKEWATLENIRCLLGKCPEKVKNQLIHAMTSRISEFRMKLKIFLRTCFFSNTTKEVDEAVGIASNIFHIILKQDQSLDDRKRYCSTRLSAQTRIFYFVIHILTMVVKSYTVIISAYKNQFNDNSRKKIDPVFVPPVIQFANMLVGGDKQDSDSWKKEVEIVFKDFRNDVLQFVQESQKVLKETSREIRNCDITYPKKGENYWRLTHFIEAQLYFKSRFLYDNVGCLKGDVIDIYNRDYGYYSGLMLHHWCGHPRINEIWTDPSDPDRLYHHFAYYKKAESLSFFNNPEIFETYGNREGKNLVSRVYPIDCALFYCMVDRKKSKTSVRRISLDFIHSSPNYVVTGIRWIVKNKIVQLELQEGLLLVNGSIDARTMRTLSAPKDTQNFVVLDYNTRELKLDELILPRDYFITGVGLILKNSMISFQIEGTKINHERLTLTTEKIVVTPEFGSKEKMTKITFDDDFPPEVAPNNTQFNVQSKPGKNYVEFGPTSFKKDAAQTTIPYFDSRYVSSNSPYPLEGLGMYFNGLQGYGGYISFNIFAVNLMTDFKVEDFEEFFDMVEQKIMNKKFDPTLLKDRQRDLLKNLPQVHW